MSNQQHFRSGLIAFALPILLASLSISIVNISIPTLVSGFQQSLNLVQWVIVVYLYRGMVQAKIQLRAGRTMEIITLDDLADDALVVPLGGMGAPTVGLEKIGRGDEGQRAVEMISDYLGVQVAATIAIEVGGTNSFVPLIAGAQLGLPTIDADGMGRAFPEWSMISFYFDGKAPSPVVMTDNLDRKIIIEQVSSPQELERIGRAVCVQAWRAGHDRRSARQCAPTARGCHPGTLTFAHQIGNAVLTAQQHSTDRSRRLLRNCARAGAVQRQDHRCRSAAGARL